MLRITVARGRAIRARDVVLFLAGVCVVSVGVTATASGDAPEPRSAVMAALDERIAAGDLQYRDPRTGEVVVATEEGISFLRDQLEQQFARAASVDPNAGGDQTASSELGTVPSDVFVRRTNLDGTRESACFRTLDAAVAFIVGLDTGAATGGPATRSAVDE